MGVSTRAYATFEIKAVDDDQRIIEGMASTPTPDRDGDVMHPEGATFALPMPLLWQHKHDKPIGQVISAQVTQAGIAIRAKIAKDVLPHVDEAWQLIKAGLVRGLSIGWRPLKAERIPNSFGLNVKEWEWFELSAVTIPMNAEATILAIKSLDVGRPAATGHPVVRLDSVNAPGASGTPVARLTPTRPGPFMTIQEQIASFQSQKQAKDARRTELMTKAGEAGSTLDAQQSEEFDTLTGEVDAIDKHLERLSAMEKANVSTVKAVAGADPAAAAASRAGVPVITVSRTLPPGIEFSQALLCKVASFLNGGSVSPAEIAKQRYPDNSRIQTYLKATVPAGSTTDTTWAGNLVDPTNLASEFIEYLRPQTIIGKFGMGSVPSLRRVPFNVRIVSQTTGGNAWWVGQGAPKPVTGFGTGATTLYWAKIAAISVITEELARFSSPSAEAFVRDGLRDALVEQLDRDFVDPATAAVSNVSPASITNGLTALTSAGTSADNVRTDLQNLLGQFILNNINPSQLVLIMPNTLALALSVQVNSLGQPEFPGITMNGGSLMGIPVITSQHAANQSGAGNLVIAVNASDIFLSDDGQVTVDASREASIQMLDNPTNNSVTGTAVSVVSMFQTNSIALRAERYINWARRRDAGVSYMDDVNWGSIGSPS